MRSVSLAVPSLATGGNRVTGLRWARCLRSLGWRARVAETWRPDDRGAGDDLLVALHARKSLPSIRAFRAAHPDRPLVVALTGTDLYVDLAEEGPRAREAREGLAAADRFVVLQEDALRSLPAELRPRARVVHQSCPTPRQPLPPREGAFDVCQLANLRAVKDPLLSARAARLVPAASRLCVHAYGSALDEDLEREAHAAHGPRWRWHGPVRRRDALCALARAHVCLSTSRAEGGANVLTEALAFDVPVLATRIPGAEGLLGGDHPGLFPVGDERALAALLARAEAEPSFLQVLRDHGRRRAWIAEPAREVAAWAALLDDLGIGAETRT